jgi:uncharacterized membrane protein YuzA (DUF378 family)
MRYNGGVSAFNNLYNNMKATHAIAFVLLVIGGLNWLLVGLFSWDVGMLFGDQGNVVSRVIYIVVGLATLYLIFTHKKTCKMCDKGSMPAQM